MKQARADALFPLYLGTTWTYRRTVKPGRGAASVTEETSKEETSKIVKIEPVPSQPHFKVTLDRGGPRYVNAMGVFQQQCDRGGHCPLYPLYNFPAKGQTTYNTMYGGDVIITVSVKALSPSLRHPRRDLQGLP